MALTEKVTSKVKKEKNEVFSKIDSLITICDKLTDIEMNTNSLANSSSGPFNFLINIGISLGVYDDMLNWLENFIIYEIPPLELTLKGILLSNLINKVSCIKDVRIPNEYRLSQPNTYNKQNNINADKGFILSVNTIDYSNLLNNSPVEKDTSIFYFGNKSDDNSSFYKSPVEFARADDMNAFLWYVIHYQKHPLAITITGNNISDFFISKANVTSINPSTAVSISNYVINGKNDNGILLGSTYKKNNSNILSINIKNFIEEHVIKQNADGSKEKERIWKSNIVPLSFDSNTTNWYSNIEYVTNSLTDIYTNKKTLRDYSKDIPILSVRYYGSDITSIAKSNRFGKISYNNLQNKLQIAVLPKPFEFFPANFTINDLNLRNLFELNMFNVKFATFNEKGEQDKNGHYSCLIKDESKAVEIPNDGLLLFELDNNQGGTNVGYLKVNLKTGTYWLAKSNSDIKQTITTDSDLCTILYECYPNMTVFSLFNDLVNGMRLLDSKVLATQLIDSILELRISDNVNFNVNVSQPTERIIEKVNNIIKNIIESDGTTIDDCFYKFSNQKFFDMITESEKRKRNNYTFIGDINSSVTISNISILNNLSAYSETVTKEENKETLHRAFTSVTNSITNNITEGQRLAIKCNIITTLLQNLSTNIVMNLLTPKIALLFEMEKQIMGDNSDSVSFEDFMNSIISVIVSTIYELADVILADFYKFIINKLEGIISCAILKMSKESVENYTQIIKDLIDNCTFGIKLSSGGNNLDTTLDNVDYADINQTPIKNDNC